MKTVLTIAGHDPSSGAGITADLTVFAAHGLFGTSCVTALTVQSTLGVAATHAVDPEVVRAVLEHLDADLPPAGIKIGMLGTRAIVEVVCEYLRQVRGRAGETVVVLDPVLRSTSGRQLLEVDGLGAMRDHLLPLVDWVTPNLAEARLLAGVGQSNIHEVGKELQAKYSGLKVVVTDGDAMPPDDLLLLPGTEPILLHGRRVDTTATHGTGCAFSSALLSRCVLGDGARAAAEGAKAYVSEALRTAERIGHGRGPMNLLWPLRGPQIDQ